VLHSGRFADLAPAEVWATLLDEGTYLGSVSTFYRVLRSQGEVRERCGQATHPAAVKPELVAAAPAATALPVQSTAAAVPAVQRPSGRPTGTYTDGSNRLRSCCPHKRMIVRRLPAARHPHHVQAQVKAQMEAAVQREVETNSRRPIV
jgi:hypothetical protein